MQSLFNYQTISAKLVKTTRTLKVELNRVQTDNAINLEMLFELESLFAWASNKVEIQTIFISSNSKAFSTGFDLSVLRKLNHNQVTKINSKLQNIVHAMMHLPQTIVLDLQDGASNLAVEFALGADIRIASNDARVELNHCKLGLTAGAGGMGLLSSLVGKLHAKNWLFSGREITCHEMKSTGFVFDSYASKQERDFIVEELLENISTQSPVARIQTKLGLLAPSLKEFETIKRSDANIAKATLATDDWKNHNQKQEAMKAKSMGYAVKLSLVKDEDGNNPEPRLRN